MLIVLDAADLEKAEKPRVTTKVHSRHWTIVSADRTSYQQFV